VGVPLPYHTPTPHQLNPRDFWILSFWLFILGINVEGLEEYERKKNDVSQMLVKGRLFGQ
jgi:hypothetical protein